MKSYQVTLSKTIRKQIWNLEETLIERIHEAIKNLADNPRHANCVKLAETKNSYRVRIGDYRIIYTIDDQQCVVDITAIGHRRDVYRR